MKIGKSAVMIITALTSLLLFTCKKENPVTPIYPGNYNYFAYDSLKTMVAQGSMTFYSDDSAHFSGIWHCEGVGSPQGIGPQIGDGTLKGRIMDSLISISLNPNYVDNNVFLSGKFQNNVIKGTWEWVGFPGRLNAGTFQLRRK